MTLYRQILVTMLLLFAVLFVTAYTVQFNSTRQYLAEQQYTNVVNTVTSLGLALTPYLETSDSVGAESVINAIFDGGFYRKVQLDLLAADSHIVREHSGQPRQVPAWFMDLQLFDEVSHEAVLTSGWLQLGKLYVEGHPGPAYYELWRGMSKLASWFVVCFIVTWLLLVAALRFLLKPLSLIRQQAKEIELHHFGKSIPVPATRELKDVVVAINNMAGMLEVQFREQADEAERLRQRAFLDETSGLGNRAYFVSQASSWISEGIQGSVALVAVDILEKVYQDEGFSSRDRMVRAIAENLQRICKRYGDYTLARISADEYAILLPETDGERLLALGNEINQSVSELIVNPVGGAELSVIGMVVISRGDTVSGLLTAADNALNKARMRQDGGIVVEQDKVEGAIGRLAWKQLVENAIRTDSFALSVQKVMNFTGETFHRELYVGMESDGVKYSAGQFMPVVEQFKLGVELDMHILRQALQMLAADAALKLAINLTKQSCASSTFWRQAGELLQQYRPVLSRLAFELPESLFVNHPEVVNEYIGQLDVAWGIDHFGRHFDMLGKLSMLRPSYVKIDHAYTSQVMEEHYDDAFLAAVCRAAHNIGALTIATRVESRDQVDRLSRLHIDAYQGFISPIEPLG
ncbi:GGDEF domain-containing protein [Zobellella endophytica]|uniref:GGDEF domain-containing protein n=1 Tax=Zobellella endophytica TaxID=2116700 RepID=A0A2P7QQE6_9GAMM|nr:LapD/MoxY N-terminal periplasmic domain-containing protein [Zobellella endophytica]PSJ40193.1 GGDEF domain-containing protein [Zobellella endophytica]